MKKLILALTCLFLAIPCQARTITVDDDGPPADFNNIQAAINDSNDGDIIIVADGIYTGEGNRDIYFSHGLPQGQTRAITVRSANGPENCIIDCNATVDDYNRHRGFSFASDEDANSVISGFTITNGYAEWEAYFPPWDIVELMGGAIYCFYSSPTISNCIISGNTATGNGRGYGGGIACSFSNPTVSNCIFAGNLAYMGGGIFNFYSNPIVSNCTFTGNIADAYGGGFCWEGILTNCVFWNNSDSGGMDESAQIHGNEAVVDYCCIQGLSGAIGGIGNIGDDPCFIEPGHWEDPCNTPTYQWDDIWIGGDYHLKSQMGRWDPNSQSWVLDDVNSPCIDAGDPNSDWTAELWPHGERINMGAYGGTPQASMSLSDTGNIADLNNDGSVDYLDMILFTDKWPFEEVLLAEDLNRDGFVDFTDFAIFGLQWSYPSASEPGITYQIEDCNQEASISFTAEPPDKTRFTVTVEGLYIHFEDMMVANCCPDELGLEMTVEDSIITIYETEYTPGGCWCICDYPVTATLGPFEPGTYILEVYEEWSGYIGSTIVVIDPPE